MSHFFFFLSDIKYLKTDKKENSIIIIKNSSIVFSSLGHCTLKVLKQPSKIIYTHWSLLFTALMNGIITRLMNICYCFQSTLVLYTTPSCSNIHIIINKREISTRKHQHILSGCKITEISDRYCDIFKLDLYSNQNIIMIPCLIIIKSP